MTRLTGADLKGLGEVGPAYDRLIKGALGVDLPALGALAADRPAPWAAERLRGRRLAAISVSSGRGVVPGFAEALAAIGRRLGLIAAAMPSPDEAGLREAEAWGADLTIQADDETFFARNLETGRIVDNDSATSRAFVAALELLNGRPLAGREVLALGLGPIGRGAAVRLRELGAWPLLFDPDPAKGPAALAAAGGGEIAPDLAGLFPARAGLIFEAVPRREVLPEHIGLPAGLRVAAPGVPLSWPLSWLRPGGPARLWHDPLPSGVAAMLTMAVA